MKQKDPDALSNTRSDKLSIGQVPSLHRKSSLGYLRCMHSNFMKNLISRNGISVFVASSRIPAQGWIRVARAGNEREILLGSDFHQVADDWVVVLRTFSSLVATATSTSRLVISLSCEFCWFCVEFILASIGSWYVWACFGTLKAWGDISEVTWAILMDSLI